MDEHKSNSDYELPQPQKLGWWKRLRMWLAKTWKSLHPSPQVRLGAAIGIFVLVFIFIVLSGMYIRPGLPGILDPLGGIFIILIMAALMGLLFALILKILFILPRFLTFWGTVALGLFLFIMKDFSIQNGLLIGFFIVAAEALLGGAIFRFFKGRFSREKLVKKVYIMVVILATVAFNAYLMYWIMGRGSSEHLVKVVADPVEVEPLGAPDPSFPGSFEVDYMTYGSGTDKRRPEFGKEARLKTEAVDATPFVKGNKGWRMKLREWFWGFDFEKFPRNGRVWFPEGDGPFPLVLCVHGNHSMADFSDPGYAYLGKLLASRGFIFVSVDENFFNGHFLGGLRTENDGRGWMLLQHLKLWKEWNQAESNPFHGKVDMDNIGLIGHSRGGEAAAIAGSFNRLSFYPDDATVEFDFGFNIKAIVAIAPSDGQYRPSGRPTPLKNVNYLTLQGAHDADVSSFSGARQYNRVRFTDDRYWFKAYIYSYRSNHGQFNTVWGDNDWGKPWGIILNKKALLSGEEQRKVGSIYITAFLETALYGKTEYIPLFRDYRRIEGWLPEDHYINRFEDSTFRIVCDFDEDVDVTTTFSDGGTIETENLATWREEDLGFRRRGTKDNNVVFLGWREPEVEEAESGEPSNAESDVLDGEPKNPASYSIVLPEGEASVLNLSADSILVFSLAPADEKPSEPEKEADDKDRKEEEDKKRNKEEKTKEDEKASKEKEEERPIDFNIELEDSDGRKGCIPLSRVRSLPPVLKSRFTKLGKESKLYGKAYEPTLQVFEIPLSIFVEENPEFDPSSLRSIRFVFDRTPEGVIILDRLGFTDLR